MTNKLKFLVKQSLDKKIKTKWFKIVNVVLLVLLIFIANIDTVVNLFGGDFNEEIQLFVEDQVGGYDLFAENLTNVASMMQSSQKYAIEKVNDISEYKEGLKDEKKETILIQILPDEGNYLKANVISYHEVGMISLGVIQSAINTVKETVAISESGLSEEEILALTSPAVVTTEITNEEESESENKEMVSSVVSLVIILPCFFLILMLVQMIGAEINDEKTTRSMEIIISNVSPKAHFLSKIIASTCFVGIQGILLLLYGGIALLSRSIFTSSELISNGTITSLASIMEMVKTSGVLDLLIQGLPFLILLFLSSFLLYAIVAGVLASMTTSIEDFQQLQTPMMLIIMIGYYLALMAVQFDGAVFIKVMAFLPMLSFLLSPVLFFLGQMTLLELGLSTLVSIFFTWVVFHYGLRIYKVGILNYSSNKLWRKMFHSLKNK